MTIRRRATLHSLKGQHYRVTNPGRPGAGNKSVFSDDVWDIMGTQYTESIGHPWASRKRGSLGDLGGPFKTVKNYIEVKPHHVRYSGPRQTTYTPVYVGPSVPYVANNAGYAEAAPMSETDMDTLGATAVARCKPTNSAFDASVFVGELMREGLPRFGPSADWKNRISAAKAAGDDYLNIQFGWQPLVDGVNDFLDASKRSYSALTQMRRDSGRVVRRRYMFEDETSVSVTDLPVGQMFPGGNWYQYTPTTARELKVETLRKCWFSGAFVYHVPDSLQGESAMAELAAVAELNFGVAFTPETLWNLTPWSWAADWFSNAGDVISNLSDSQRYGLIMPYGYIMVNTIQKRTYSVSGVSDYGGSGNVPGSITFVTESKQRGKANPFGFGVSDGDLDPGQISILAALGLSRSR